MREVVFTGSAGRLEGKFCQSVVPNSAAVLILHPHPLHGGTMNNKVVYRLFHSFVAHHCSVLRFNFRGVGNSQGQFDYGTGEMTDAAAALDWLQSRVPDASSYWVAGFSFGSWIAMQLMMRRPEISKFVAVAPPVDSFDFSFLAPCPASGLIIQGMEDEIVKEESVYKLYERLSKQRNIEIDYQMIDGANHVFDGKLKELDTILGNYLESHLSYEAPKSKIKKDRRKRQIIPHGDINSDSAEN